MFLELDWAVGWKIGSRPQLDMDRCPLVRGRFYREHPDQFPWISRYRKVRSQLRRRFTRRPPGRFLCRGHSGPIREDGRSFVGTEAERHARQSRTNRGIRGSQLRHFGFWRRPMSPLLGGIHEEIWRGSGIPLRGRNAHEKDRPQISEGRLSVHAQDITLDPTHI